MEWPQKLLNIHTAIQNEPGRRVFKSMLIDILGPSEDQIEVLKEKLKDVQKDIHSVTTKTGIHYMSTLTKQIASIERLQHALETAMAHLEQREKALDNDMSAMKQDISALFPTTHSQETEVQKLVHDVTPIKHIYNELLTKKHDGDC